MRTNIISHGSQELNYEIRSILEIAAKLKPYFGEMIWENIGDPIEKGHKVAAWIKDIVSDLAQKDCTYAYSPTKGLDLTRNFLADLTNSKGGIKITKSDIIFFNGLGDAISTIYTFLKKEARILGSSPSYPTHSSAEAAHADSLHITFKLDPNNGWLPDLDYINNVLKYNNSIAGLLLVNPDNPTGLVYPKDYLEQIVKMAKQYDLFLIVDEIYENIVYNGKQNTSLSEIIEDVPALSLKGISKEFPWPGARCGWIEVYNKFKDSMFTQYVNTIKKAKMLEVCSTTLPQKAIPIVMQDQRYDDYIYKRNKDFEKKSNIAYETFKDCEGVVVNKTNGAFYFSIVFDKDVLNPKQCLKLSQEKLDIISPHLKGVSNDKRFVLYLLAAKGICIVPLTGFNTKMNGFRMTLLEPDMDKFQKTCNLIREAIEEYLGSYSV